MANLKGSARFYHPSLQAQNPWKQLRAAQRHGRALQAERQHTKELLIAQACKELAEQLCQRVFEQRTLNPKQCVQALLASSQGEEQGGAFCPFLQEELSSATGALLKEELEAWREVWVAFEVWTEDKQVLEKLLKRLAKKHCEQLQCQLDGLSSLESLRSVRRFRQEALPREA